MKRKWKPDRRGVRLLALLEGGPTSIHFFSQTPLENMKPDIRIASKMRVDSFDLNMYMQMCVKERVHEFGKKMQELISKRDAHLRRWHRSGNGPTGPCEK